MGRITWSTFFFCGGHLVGQNIIDRIHFRAHLHIVKMLNQTIDGNTNSYACFASNAVNIWYLSLLSTVSVKLTFLCTSFGQTWRRLMWRNRNLSSVFSQSEIVFFSWIYSLFFGFPHLHLISTQPVLFIILSLLSLD